MNIESLCMLSMLMSLNKHPLLATAFLALAFAQMVVR